ncbi:MAG TPA: hypothetical protein VI953_03170 [Candidatus Paceibacterota bacterium]
MTEEGQTALAKEEVAKRRQTILRAHLQEIAEDFATICNLPPDKNAGWNWQPVLDTLTLSKLWGTNAAETVRRATNCLRDVKRFWERERGGSDRGLPLFKLIMKVVRHLEIDGFTEFVGVLAINTPEHERAVDLDQFPREEFVP